MHVGVCLTHASLATDLCVVQSLSWASLDDAKVTVKICAGELSTRDT